MAKSVNNMIVGINGHFVTKAIEFKLSDRGELYISRSGEERVRSNINMVKALDVLLDNRGQIVTKKELEKSVWSHGMIGSNSLPVLIKSIRDVIKGTELVLMTVRAQGYAILDKQGI